MHQKQISKFLIFRIQIIIFDLLELGVGFKIQNSKIQKFKIQDSRFKIQDSRFKIQDSRFKIQNSKILTTLITDSQMLLNKIPTVVVRSQMLVNEFLTLITGL